eukprot:m.248165 g.248165  ORF g.248165 m.248165 type:complete len:69 (+) comp17162_c2_seq2:224-430(+)
MYDKQCNHSFELKAVVSGAIRVSATGRAAILCGVAASTEASGKVVTVNTHEGRVASKYQGAVDAHDAA